jgi:hypothetical protein
MIRQGALAGPAQSFVTAGSSSTAMAFWWHLFQDSVSDSLKTAEHMPPGTGPAVATGPGELITDTDGPAAAFDAGQP